MGLSEAALRERLEDMARRGLFVRDDFGRADPCAVTEIIALCSNASDELARALELARDNLFAWNAMAFVGNAEAEEEMTRLYQESPEIKAIDAALARARGVVEGP